MCTIFVHPLFPVFEPHIQRWVIFVRRRPCVCDTFRFESPPPRKKDRIWHRLPPPPPSSGLRQLNFPNVKNDAGQKQQSPWFFEKASPAEGRRRHVQQKGRLKVHRWLFRVFGVFSVGFKGVVGGLNFGFGRTKTTLIVTWGSILTPCRKNAQNTAEKLKLHKNKAKSKMVFRAYDSKEVDKKGAKCNMGFGRKTKTYREKRGEPSN